MLCLVRTGSLSNLEKLQEWEDSKWNFEQRLQSAPRKGQALYTLMLQWQWILPHKHTLGGNVSSKIRILIESYCEQNASSVCLKQTNEKGRKELRLLANTKKFFSWKIQWSLQPWHCTDPVNSHNTFRKSQSCKFVPSYRPSIAEVSKAWAVLTRKACWHSTR